MRATLLAAAGGCRRNDVWQTTEASLLPPGVQGALLPLVQQKYCNCVSVEGSHSLKSLCWHQYRRSKDCSKIIFWLGVAVKSLWKVKEMCDLKILERYFTEEFGVHIYLNKKLVFKLKVLYGCKCMLGIVSVQNDWKVFPSGETTTAPRTHQ